METKRKDRQTFRWPSNGNLTKTNRSSMISRVSLFKKNRKCQAFLSLIPEGKSVRSFRCSTAKLGCGQSGKSKDCTQTELTTPTIETSPKQGKQKAKSDPRTIKRSWTVPDKPFVYNRTQNPMNGYRGNGLDEDLTFSLEKSEGHETSTDETIEMDPSYDVVPRSRSMFTLTSSRRGSRRPRSSLIVRKTTLPRMDEESSLKMEEMIGFECIETEIFKSPKRFYRSRGRVGKADSRLDDAEGEYGTGTRDDDSVDVTHIFERTASRLGSVSLSSRESSVSTKSSSQRSGPFHWRLSSFTGSRRSAIGSQHSKHTSVYEDDIPVKHDTSTVWTEDHSSGFDKRSYKNRCSSYSDSSRSSSSSYSYSEDNNEESDEEDDDEDKEDDDEEDDEEEDDETYSIATNSTMSTRDSILRTKWNTTVAFDRAMLQTNSSSE